MRLEDAYRGGLLFCRGGSHRRYLLKRPNSQNGMPLGIPYETVEWL